MYSVRALFLPVVIETVGVDTLAYYVLCLVVVCSDSYTPTHDLQYINVFCTALTPECRNYV